MADALILAAYGGSSLWAKTQAAYFKKNSSPFNRVVSAVVNGQLREIVEQTELSNWKSALAIICTYAKREEFAVLSGLLGDRLLSHGDSKSAILCFICAGNIEKTVQLWTKHSDNSTVSLQTLIEKVSVFRRAIHHKEPLNPALATKFAEYAHILASQGKLTSAIQNLSFVSETKLDESNILPFVLLDRLYHAQKTQNIAPPPFPFKKQEVPLPQSQQNRPAPQPVKTASSTPFMQNQQRPPDAFQSVPTPFPSNRNPFPSTPSPFPTNVAPAPIKSAMPPQPNVFVPTPNQVVPSHPHSHPHPHPTPVGPPPSTVSHVGPPPPSVPIVSAPKTMAPPPNVSSPPMSHPPPEVKKEAPMPPPSQPIGPPPTTGVQGNLGKTPSAPPAPAPAPKPAQTTQESQYIIDQLNSILATCSKSNDPKVTKLIPDVRKRFEPLFEKLVKNDFSASGTQSLTQFVQAINSGDVKTAQNIHITLTQNNWDEFGSSLMIGLKRLVEIAKS